MKILSKNRVVVSIALVFIVGIGLWYGIKVYMSRNTTEASQPALDGSTILIREDGFFPDTLTVRSGTTVKFVNEDKYWHWPASDPHPSHTFYSELDPREPIKPGGIWQVMLTKPGKWGIHDHLAPYVVGQIIVTNEQ